MADREVTREAARAELERLAAGVARDAGATRLLERVAEVGAEELRAALLEEGAAAVLQRVSR